MRFIKLLCTVCLLLTLVGCFDYNELNMQEIVNGVGIDSGEEGVRVNVVCAPTGGIDDKEGARYTAEGGSFFEAVRALGSRADKKLYWGHTSCILIGEDAARYTDEILDTVLRVQDVYLDIAPVIVRGSRAEELIDTAQPGGRDVFESISDMFRNDYDIDNLPNDVKMLSDCYMNADENRTLKILKFVIEQENGPED